MNALEILNLSKKYNNKIALSKLNLTLKKGMFLGLLGPNGAGKSTIINIIGGVTKSSNGTIKIFDEEISVNNFAYKRISGFLFEQDYYLSKLSAQEYLEFAAIMYGLSTRNAKKRTSELLEFFDLPSDDKYIKKFSTGMKKKLGLAVAIIHHPQILFLDEPLENLDPIASKTVLDFLKMYIEKGNTVLMSSHQIEKIENNCDEIVIIDQGENIISGNISRIKTQLPNSDKSLVDFYIKNVSTKVKKSKLVW